MTARAGVLAMSIVACTHPRPPVNGADLERVQRWWIVIGHSPVLESLDWRHYARDAQMVVVSGDPRIPIGEFPSATIRLAYLSVGEADRAPSVLAGGARISRSSSSPIPTGPTTSASTCATRTGRRSSCATRCRA